VGWILDIHREENKFNIYGLLVEIKFGKELELKISVLVATI
jgi:hypothetical protein